MLPTVVALICLGSVGMVIAGITDMGQCTRTFPGVDNWDFDSYMTEGCKSLCYVPNNEHWKYVSWAIICFKVIGHQVTEYQLIRKDFCQQPVVYSNQIRLYQDRGSAICRSKTGNFELLHSTITHVEQNYTTFMMCSSDGDDYNTDYRFTACDNGYLCKKHREEIEEVDRNMKLKGSIKYIGDKRCDKLCYDECGSDWDSECDSWSDSECDWESDFGCDSESDIGCDSKCDCESDIGCYSECDCESDIGCYSECDCDSDCDIGCDSESDIGCDIDSDIGCDSESDIGCDSESDIGCDRECNFESDVGCAYAFF